MKRSFSAITTAISVIICCSSVLVNALVLDLDKVHFHVGKGSALLELLQDDSALLETLEEVDNGPVSMNMSVSRQAIAFVPSPMSFTSIISER